MPLGCAPDFKTSWVGDIPILKCQIGLCHDHLVSILSLLSIGESPPFVCVGLDQERHTQTHQFVFLPANPLEVHTFNTESMCLQGFSVTNFHVHWQVTKATKHYHYCTHFLPQCVIIHNETVGTCITVIAFISGQVHKLSNMNEALTLYHQVTGQIIQGQTL